MFDQKTTKPGRKETGDHPSQEEGGKEVAKSLKLREQRRNRTKFYITRLRITKTWRNRLSKTVVILIILPQADLIRL